MDTELDYIILDTELRIGDRRVTRWAIINYYRQELISEGYPTTKLGKLYKKGREEATSRVNHKLSVMGWKSILPLTK